MGSTSRTFDGFLLQDNPRIYIVALPGFWLLDHATPSWRIKDPVIGFQRSIKEQRARDIAISVLDQKRTFPNSIVLATDANEIKIDQDRIIIDENVKFFVVDGQHRLWAQHFSKFEALYACMIHTGLSEQDMASLFLEINDNQKRVPSSLRWDLIRLVKPEDDPNALASSEIVFLLATEKGSPLFQRIDLTGEQSEIRLKQGSLAPEIKNLIIKTKILNEESLDKLYNIFYNFFYALMVSEGDSWGTNESPFYDTRVVRALIRLLANIIKNNDINLKDSTYKSFLPYIEKISKDRLISKEIKSKQGSAGIKAIYDEIFSQVYKIE